MAKKGLTLANTLRSNNTTSTGYGIVYADEIIGSRSVKTKEDLNKLPDWVLGKDNKLEKGTTYYVENERCFYIYTGSEWKQSFKAIGLPVKSWYAYNDNVTGTAATSQILDISKIIKGDDLYVGTLDGIEEQPHPFATIVVYNDEVNKVPIAYITLFESSDPDNPENNTVVASAKVFGSINNNTFPRTPDFNNINYYEGSCRPLDTGPLITTWRQTGGNSIISKVWELNDFSIKGNTIKTSEIDFTTDTLQKFNDSISSGDHVIKTQYSVVDATHDNIVGQMLLIGDSLGHMVTEILTTSAELKDGVIDWNAHSDTEVNTYIRRNHVKEGGTSSIAVGSWSKWTYYSGEGQYNDFKILVAGELSKKVNTSDVVQQTGDSTTSVMSLKAVSHELANLPDEEDLTFVKESGRDVLKLADRNYAPENFSGKGYKILRKNIVNGKNVLTQEMINEPNTIYEIRYDFDLNNKYIKLPLNSDLFINGGSIKNGVVVCNNSRISDFKAISDIRGICLDYNTGKETTIYGDIINRNVILAGTVNICWNNLDKFGLSKSLLLLQKVGINDIVIAFKTKILNSEFVLLDQDDKKINNLNSYINGGARVKMLKFHQPENEEDKWIKNPTEEQKSSALEYAVKFKNYVLKNVKEFSKYIDFEYVGISNEDNYWETNTEFATILSDLAKEVTTLGYKPICSRNNTATMPTVLAEQLYMYGYNNYGSLSYRDDKSEYNKYMYLGFHNISNSQLSSVKNQLIFITECGVRPYDKSLRAGSYYNISLLGNKNFKIPIIYYKSMKDYIKNNPVYCVTDWWFENYTAFDINNNNLHKELYNILLNL